MATHFEFKTIQEPVEKYTLLKKFYEDPKTNAYDFQLQVINVLTELSEKEFQDQNCIIAERSISSCRIFCKTLKIASHLTDEQFCFLMKKINEVEKHILENWKVMYIILNINPSVALAHIKKRGRQGEEEIQLPYLRSLVKHHMAMPEEISAMNTTFEILDVSQDDDESQLALRVMEAVNKHVYG